MNYLKKPLINYTACTVSSSLQLEGPCLHVFICLCAFVVSVLLSQEGGVADIWL